MKDLNIYSKVAYILVLIGGICWGLAGLFDIYLVTGIFGHLLGRIIYVLVGVSAGYLAYLLYVEKMRKM